VDFVNCDAQDGDWIALYHVEDIDLRDDSYYDWRYTCGDRDCDTSPEQGTVSLRLQTLEEDGTYQVVLARDGVDTSLYVFLAMDGNTLIVSDDC